MLVGKRQTITSKFCLEISRISKGKKLLTSEPTYYEASNML